MIMLSCVDNEYPREVHSIHLARLPGGERKQDRAGGFSTRAILYLAGSGIIIVYHRASSSDTPLRSRDPTCADVHHDLQFHYFSLTSIVKKVGEERREEGKDKKRKEEDRFSLFL